MKHWWILLVPSLALAQAKQSDTLSDIEIKFKEPERFSEARHVNTAVYEYPYRPVSLAYIKISPVVQRALHENARIQDIRTLKLTTNSRRVLINVHERSDEKGFFYIVDADGGVTRRVQMNFVEPIDPITEMYEPPKNYVEVVRQKDDPADNRRTGLISQFSLRFAQTDANWTADLLNDTKATNAVSTTIGTNLLLNWEESFRLGGTFQYESSSHRLQSGTAQYKNPSIGLLIQSPPSEWGGGPWRVGAQVRTGPLATIQVADANGRPVNLKVRITTFQLDWQYIGKNDWGEWSLGVAFQRDYPKLRRQEVLAQLDSQSRVNDQVGIFVTQGFAW